MVDNIDVTPGTGATIAADDVGGFLFQRVKVTWGADGAANDTSAANPLPVVLTAASVNVGDVDVLSSALPTGAATAAKQPALGTAGSPSADVISIQGVASGTVVPVSGTFWQATQPVSLASLPALAAGTNNIGDVDVLTLPTTQVPATLGQKAMANSLAVVIASDQSALAVTGTFWQATQPVSAASLPLPSGAATAAKQPALGTAGSASADVLSVQGIASGTALAVSAASLPLPSGAATSANQTTEQGLVGALTETAPASDTASSGLNGRLQRVAQRITSLIAQIPAALGQTTMANSMSVAIASNQSAVPVSGTFWQATQPVSLAALPALVAGTANIGDVDVLTLPTTQVPASLGQKTMANSLAVVIASDQSAVPVSGSFTNAASENHIGQVGGEGDIIDVTLSLDTSAYAVGDVMADTQAVSNAVRANDKQAILQSILVVDEDDQGAAFDILFLSANNSLGTENAAPSITDANAREILGVVSITAADYIDLGGVRVATKPVIGLKVKPASGTRTVYVGTITRGTPTHTASGVRLRLGMLWD